MEQMIWNASKEKFLLQVIMVLHRPNEINR